MHSYNYAEDMTMTAQTLSIDFAGHRRTVFLRPCARPRMAVLLLHPVASSGKAMAIGGGWAQIEDLYLVAPDGLALNPSEDRSESNPRCWTSGETGDGRRVDDAGFLDALLDVVLPQIPTDVPLVIVGHSNGCAMGFRLLGESRHRARFGAAVLYAAAWAAGRNSLNVPLLYMTGDSDPIRPFHGNVEVCTPWFKLRTTPVMDTVRECLLQVGAAPEAPSIDPAADFTAMRWGGGRAPFEFRILRGQGHHWPVGAALDPALERVVGPNNGALNATEMALGFIEQHLQVAA